MAAPLFLTGVTCNRETSWYLGSGIAERVRALGPCAGQRYPDPERGRQKLRSWETRPYHDPTLLAQWLDRLGLDRERLQGVVSASGEDLKDAFGETPEWLRRFLSTLDAGDLGPSSADERQLPFEIPPLLKPLAALLRTASQGIAGRVEALTDANRIRNDAGRLTSLLGASWPRAALTRVFLRIAVLEMHVARLRGELRAVDPRERFAEFASTLGHADSAVQLFLQYPAAARECQRTLDRWIDARTEFTRHLIDDLPLLKARLSPEGGELNVDSVREISFGLGDSHRGGRSVALVTFDRVAPVVYKPRSLRVDELFQAFLQWTNDSGFEPGMRPLWVLDRGDHGWMEYVPAVACTGSSCAVQFYRRLGGYLALLYLLHGRDMHRENLIAHGEHPMLVDLEGLFHAELSHPASLDLESSAARELQIATVLATGLLPAPHTYKQEGQVGLADLSGLSAGNSVSTDEVETWQDTDTDQMRIVRQRVPLGESRHVPVVNGQAETVLAYGDDFEQGFRDMYRLLLSRRTALSDPAGPLARFAQAPVRVLLRSTQIYAEMLDQSYHPELLQDAVDREHYLAMLFGGAASLTEAAALAESERQQVGGGDIPLFTTTPGERDLTGGDGTSISEALDYSGLEAVNSRLGHLSEHDLTRQVWVIRAALSTARLEGKRPEWPVHSIQWREKVLDDHVLIEHAIALGDELLATAIPVRGTLGWLGIQPLEDDHWQLKGVGPDLYSGLSGVALFLLYLGQISGERRFTNAARSITYQLASALAHLSDSNPDMAEGLLGMCGSLDGPLYVLAHWAAVSGDVSVLESATSKRILDLLERSIESDTTLDIIGGVAATILVLDALDKVCLDLSVTRVLNCAASRIVALAHRIDGTASWRSAQFEGRALSGASHGAAGIALSLARVWKRCGTSVWRDIVFEALAWERSQFDPELPGWPDRRPGVSGAGMTTAWCHGAPGIGVVRLALAEAAPELGAGEDIQTAVSATLAHYNNGRERDLVRLSNLSLCHGEIGNIEFLAWAARHLDNPGLARYAQRLCCAALEMTKEHGWICGVPHGLTNPGLMTGLCGIGYGLLRLAAPNHVPSVLTLDGPRVHRTPLS